MKQMAHQLKLAVDGVVDANTSHGHWLSGGSTNMYWLVPKLAWGAAVQLEDTSGDEVGWYDMQGRVVVKSVA